MAAMTQQHQPPPLPCLILECHNLADDASGAKSAASATASSVLPKPTQIRVFTFCPTMMMCRGGDVAGVDMANCLAKLVKVVIVCHCSHTHENVFTYQTLPGSKPPSAADWADVLTYRTPANAATAGPEQQENLSDPEDPRKTLSAPLHEEHRDTQQQPQPSGVFYMPAKQTYQKGNENDAICDSMELDVIEEIGSSLVEKRRKIHRQLTEQRVQMLLERQQLEKQQQQSQGSVKSPANSGGRNTSAEETRTAETVTPQADIEKKYFTAVMSTTREALSQESPLLVAAASGEVQRKVPPPIELPRIEFESADIDDAMSCCPYTPNTTATGGASNSSEKEDAMAPTKESSSHAAWGVVPLPEPLEDLVQRNEGSSEKQGVVQHAFTVLSSLSTKELVTMNETPKDIPREKPEADWTLTSLNSLQSLGGNVGSDMITEPGSQQSDPSLPVSCATDFSPKALSVDNSEPCQNPAPTTAVDAAAQSASAPDTEAAAVADEMNRRKDSFREYSLSSQSENSSPPTADRIKELESEINATEAGTAAQTKQEGKTPAQPQQQQQPQPPTSPKESVQSQWSSGHCEGQPLSFYQQISTRNADGDAPADKMRRLEGSSSNQTEKASPPTADQIKQLESEINDAEAGTKVQTELEGKTPAQSQQQQQPQPPTSPKESVQSQCSRECCQDQPPVVYQQYPMSRIFEVNRCMVAATSPETGGLSGISVSLAESASLSLQVMTSRFHGADIFKETMQDLDVTSIVTTVNDAKQLPCSSAVDQREVAPPPPLSQKPLTTTAAATQDSATTPHAGQAAATAADCGSTMDSMSARVGSLDVFSSSSTRSRLYDTALTELRLQHQQRDQRQLEQRHDGGESDRIPATGCAMTGTSCELKSGATRTQNTSTTDAATAAWTLQCCERSAWHQTLSTVTCCQQDFSPLHIVHQLACQPSCGFCQTVACVSSGAHLLTVTYPPRVRRCPQLSAMPSMATTCGNEAGCAPQQQQQQEQPMTPSHIQRPHRHNRSSHHHRHQPHHPTTGGHNTATATGDSTLSWERLLVPDAVGRLKGLYLGDSGCGCGSGNLKQVPNQEWGYAASGQHQHLMLHQSSLISSELAALSTAAAACPSVKSEAAVHVIVQPSETTSVLANISETDTGSWYHQFDL